MPKIITLTVTNNSTFIHDPLSKEDRDSLKRELGYMPENAAFMVANSKFDNKEWDGHKSVMCSGKRWCKCAIKKDGVHFPTGLTHTAKAHLEKEGFTVKMVDNRIKVVSNGNYAVTGGKLREYQQRVVAKSAKRQRGLVKMATGAGKTFTGAALISELNVYPFIFYVPSLDLLHQTKEEFERILTNQGKPAKIGMIGGGECDIQDINVMTQQTAIRALGKQYTKSDEDDKAEKDTDKVKEKYKDIRNLIMTAKGMIADEVQHWSADTCQTISDYSVECYYKYGFSATPYRDQGDDILIDSCFGKVIEDINASELIDLGFLVKPDIFMVPVKNKYGTLKGHTYQEIYKDAIVENHLRNGYVKRITESMVQQDKMVLILVRQINHGKILEELIPGSNFISGTSSKKKRRDHIAAMKNHEAPVTISTSIFDEGVDVKPLQVMIQAGSGKSMTRALQRVGRVLRPYDYPDGTKKTEAIVVDFMDHCRYMLGHSKKRLKIYKTEPRFNIETLKL